MSSVGGARCKACNEFAEPEPEGRLVRLLRVPVMTPEQTQAVGELVVVVCDWLDGFGPGEVHFVFDESLSVDQLVELARAMCLVLP